MANGIEDATMIAGLLGSTNAFAGWLMHLSIAAFAGTGFGVLLGDLAGRLAPAAVAGRREEAAWLTDRLAHDAPDLLGLVGHGVGD